MARTTVDRKLAPAWCPGHARVVPPPAPQLRLGLFDLYQVIGRGGMAEVWSGAHAEQGLPVAVKLITAMQARRPEYRAAFRTEVRAMAALDHPGILTVYDYGEVDAAALRSTKRKLELGCPYIVM